MSRTHSTEWFLKRFYLVIMSILLRAFKVIHQPFNREQHVIISLRITLY